MTMQIHIAGFPVRIGTKIRQLCAWCSYTFTDSDLADMAVAPNADGSPGPDPAKTWFWQTGDLIAVDGGVSSLVRHKDGEPIPPQCCASPGLELVP